MRIFIILLVVCVPMAVGAHDVFSDYVNRGGVTPWNPNTACTTAPANQVNVYINNDTGAGYRPYQAMPYPVQLYMMDQNNYPNIDTWRFGSPSDFRKFNKRRYQRWRK